MACVRTVCFWSYSVFAIVWKYALGRQGCRHYTVEERGPYTHYIYYYGYGHFVRGRGGVIQNFSKVIIQ
jgi:hypothetical protein